ncbi:MAG: T9SS type A sorting domain-containing protein [candidate division WOR-3 bacterium]
MKSFTSLLFGLAFILFTFPNLSLAQYARVYGGEREERAYALSEGAIPGTRIREYVLAGWTQSYSDRRNPLVIGVNQVNGNFLWGLIANDTGEFHSIAKARDGFVLAGYISLAGRETGMDIMVAKVSLNGQFLWGKVYLAQADDFANSIVQTRDGGYAVCGWTNSFGPNPKPNIIVMKLDSLGNLKWSRVYWFYNHLGADQAFSITELPFYPNNPRMRYAIVGRTQVYSDARYDAFVLTLDTLGNIVWPRVMPGAYDEEAHSVVVTNDTIAVAGWTNSFNQFHDADIFLWKLWAYDGSRMTQKGYGEPFIDEKVGDDRCLVLKSPSLTHPYNFLIAGWTGHTPAPAGGTDFQYLALDKSAAPVWMRRHPSFANGTPHIEAAYPALISGSYIAIAGFSDNDAFSWREDMHLLRTPLSGLNRVCTALDSGPTYYFTADSIKYCLSDSAPLPMTFFFMDTIRVPVRKLCTLSTPNPFGPVPAPSISAKAVKSGGGLVALGNNLYLLVGNNTRDFGRYNLEDGVWSKEESVPLGVRNKKVKKGACMIAIPGMDGKGVEGEIYLLKGGGTNEFYKFTPNGKGWQELPEPGFMKGVKGGFMAAVTVNDCTYIYAGSGYKNEWKRFNLQTGQWEKCIPETLPGGNWKIGSSMDGFFDGVKNGNLPNKLILMQAGGRENNIFMFNPQPEPPGFLKLASLPLVGRSARKKKVGEGASIRMFNPQPEPPGEGKGVEPSPWFLATKGKNTKEFWQLEISSAEDDTGHWTQLPDIPSEKGIKGGGSLTYSPWDLAVYLTVGNNTNEIFAYYPSQEESLFSFFPKEPSSMGKADKASHRVRISNPARGLATIYYNLPKKEKVALKIYNMLGDIVYSEKTDRGFFLIKKLPAGIYLLRFESKDYKEERKLILVK